MAAIADRMPTSARRDGGFFMISAVVMAVLVVAGFSLQLAMGRSTFASPPLVHAHAIVFMGWVTIYVLQNAFVATDRMALHRRLGWVACFWVLAMLALGCAVTVAMIREARVPFFFRPLQFLVFDPLSLFTFAGLTAAAVALRRQTDWHRRLHFCGMAILLGPAFGRLLPMPLLAPWAWEVDAAVCLLFPLAGMVVDQRRDGRIHPAWLWGVAATLVFIVLTEAITYSPIGTALYQAVATGSQGEAVAPLAFPPPPGPPPVS